MLLWKFHCQRSCTNLCFPLNITCHHMSCLVLVFQYTECLIVKCFSSALCCLHHLCKFCFLVQILLFVQIPLSFAGSTFCADSAFQYKFLLCRSVKILLSCADSAFLCRFCFCALCALCKFHFLC